MEHIKRPQVRPDLLARISGFTSHAVVKVLQLNVRVTAFAKREEEMRLAHSELLAFTQRSTRNRKAKLNRIRSIEVSVQNLCSMLDYLVGVLSAETGAQRKQLLETLRSLSADLKRSHAAIHDFLLACEKSPGNMSSSKSLLDDCALRVRDILRDLEVEPDIFGVIEAARALGREICDAIGSLEDLSLGKSSPFSSSAPLKKYCQTLEKNFATSISATDEFCRALSSSAVKHVFSGASRVTEAFHTLDSKSRLSDLTVLVRFIQLLDDNNMEVEDEAVLLLTETLHQYLERCSALAASAKELVKVLCAYISRIMDYFMMFLALDFAPTKEPSGETDKEDLKEGVGLGDGKADKNTLDDLESEDLFENETGKGGEEEDEGDGEKEDCDGIEYEGGLDNKANDNVPSSDEEDEKEDDQDKKEDEESDFEFGEASDDEPEDQGTGDKEDEADNDQAEEDAKNAEKRTRKQDPQEQQVEDAVEDSVYPNIEECEPEELDLGEDENMDNGSDEGSEVNDKDFGKLYSYIASNKFCVHLHF